MMRTAVSMMSLVVMLLTGCLAGGDDHSPRSLTQVLDGYTITTTQGDSGASTTTVDDGADTRLVSMNAAADLRNVDLMFTGASATRLAVGEAVDRWIIDFESELALLNQLVLEAIHYENGDGNPVFHVDCERGQSELCLFGHSFCWCRDR